MRGGTSSSEEIGDVCRAYVLLLLEEVGVITMGVGPSTDGMGVPSLVGAGPLSVGIGVPCLDCLPRGSIPEANRAIWLRGSVTGEGVCSSFGGSL